MPVRRLHLGEVGGVGPGRDRHHDVGQGAEAVGDRQSPRGGYCRPRISSDRQAVEAEERDHEPVGQPPGPRRQPDARGPLGDHLHVGDVGRRGRVEHRGQQVVPGQPGHHAGSQILVHGSAFEVGESVDYAVETDRQIGLGPTTPDAGVAADPLTSGR